MYISEVTSNKLNDLLTFTFQMNAIMDNLAYNLAFDKMIQTEPIFHERFAHAFPALADQISELMLQLNCLPSRGPLTNVSDRRDNIIDIFTDVLNAVRKYRANIIAVVDAADFNDDYEVKIVMEDYLHNFIKYIDQAETWAKKANEYGADAKGFDNHFADFTSI